MLGPEFSTKTTQNVKKIYQVISDSFVCGSHFISSMDLVTRQKVLYVIDFSTVIIGIPTKKNQTCMMILELGLLERDRAAVKKNNLNKISRFFTDNL